MGRAGKGKHENRDRVDEMIEYSFVPNVDHRIALNDRFKRVRSKCTERDSEKAEHGSNASKQSPRHDRTLYLSNATRLLPKKK